jgi:uncharacterized protein YbaP (TraB family)
MGQLLRTLRFLTLAVVALAATLSSPAAVAQESPASPALWVVRDADTTVYLFGTIHTLPAGTTWFQSGVKAAFDRSAELVLEMVMPTADQLQGTLLRRALAPGAAPVASRLPGRTGEAYTAALAALGVPTRALDPFQTWFAAVTLSAAAAQQAGFDLTHGAEVVLSRAAEAARKPVIGLESLDEQLAFLGSMPEALQVRYLAATVSELADAPKTLAAMLDAWRLGDAEALAAVMDQGLGDLPEVKDLLLTRRNARWARWVAERMKTPGTVFLAVGAGHLVGTQSVQTELAKLGLRAERAPR